jgi:hypothetical protein
LEFVNNRGLLFQDIHKNPSSKQPVIASPAFFAVRSNLDCRNLKFGEEIASTPEKAPASRNDTLTCNIPSNLVKVLIAFYDFPSGLRINC